MTRQRLAFNFLDTEECNPLKYRGDLIVLHVYGGLRSESGIAWGAPIAVSSRKMLSAILRTYLH
jgi:hypothetical protein